MAQSSSSTVGQFNTRIPKPLIRRVREDAQRRGVSINLLTQWALEHWIDFAPPPEPPLGVSTGSAFDQSGVGTQSAAPGVFSPELPPDGPVPPADDFVDGGTL